MRADPLAFVGLHSSVEAQRALSAADVGARVPSWNHEAGFGTFLLHAPTMLGPSAIALAIQMGLSPEACRAVLHAFAGCEGEASSQGGFCRWVEGTGPRLRPCP